MNHTSQWLEIMDRLHDLEKEKLQMDTIENNVCFTDIVKRFIVSVGGVAEAARLMKISYTTMCRWKDGDTKPQDPSVEKSMRELVNGSVIDPALLAKYSKSPRMGLNRLTDGVVASVEHAMASHPRTVDGYRVAKINKKDYAILQKIILLRDRHDISTADRESIIRVLKEVDQARSCALVKKEMHDILDRNWPRLKNKPPEYIVKREQRRFDMTIINVSEVCSSMSDMTIPPDLSDIQRDASIATLMTSVINISNLVKRLVGEKEQSYE